MSLKSKQSIVFLPEGRELAFVEGDTVLEIAEFHRLGLAHSCGGMGSCGTCRIFVDGGAEAIPPKVGLELEMAENRGFQDNERLACQLCAVPGLRFRAPEED